MDKISVVTANYNRSSLLEKAILSIATQKSDIPFDWEMIIVDDGSTDDSLNIIEKYTKKYPENIRLFSQKNGGANKARNVGLNNLSKNSTYLIFLDNDDEITSGTFDFYLKTWESLKKSGKYQDVFTLNAFCEDEYGELVGDKKILAGHKKMIFDYKKYLSNLFVLKEMTGIGKSFLYIENKNFRFDENQLIGESILWLSIYKYCFQKGWYALIVDHSARIFRLHHGTRTSRNISKQRFLNSAISNIKVLHIIEGDLIKYLFISIYAELLFRIGINYLLYGNRKEGLSFMKKSLKVKILLRSLLLYLISLFFPWIIPIIYKLYIMKDG